MQAFRWQTKSVYKGKTHKTLAKQNSTEPEELKMVGGNGYEDQRMDSNL